MAVSHFSHEHPLTLVEVEEEDLECNGCNRFIAGPVYTCRDCNFNLHKSCFDLPTEVSHRFHQDHPLFLRFLDKESKCTRCFDPCVGFIYHCNECNFTLDHKCAVLTNISVQEAGQEKNSIDHFVHNHSLMFHDNFHRSKLSCLVCRSRLSGCPVYFCLQCNFCIHESCMWKIQPETENPFHPHSLIAFSTTSEVECGSCKMNFKGISYCCLKCKFFLHVQCANSAEQMTTLKLKYREHNFYYFESKINSLFMCDACDTSCIGSFYRCVRCDFNLHFECIPLPESIFKCKFHKHKPLVFKDEYVDEEYIEGHYCDFCEELRNPKESVYYCDECKSAAHIACVVEDQRMEVLSYMVPRKSSRQLQHFIHAHPLHEEQVEDSLCCNGCSQMISGPAYGCEECKFHLHKSCLELPFEIQGPWHPMHPVFLILPTQNFKKCQKCGDPCSGWTYLCGRCSFFIHAKCASLTMEEENEVQRSDVEDWVGGVTEGSDKEYESNSEEEEIDAEKNGSDGEEHTIAQLDEIIHSLLDEAETLTKKIETLQAIKERLLNASRNQS